MSVHPDATADEDPMLGPDLEHISEESTFVRALEHLINMYNMESGSDTPDFVLAKFLQAVLADFDAAVNRRCQWYQCNCQSLEHSLEPQRRIRGWRGRSWPVRLRFALLIPGSHKWNGWVRDATARLERTHD